MHSCDAFYEGWYLDENLLFSGLHANHEGTSRTCRAKAFNRVSTCPVLLAAVPRARCDGGLRQHQHAPRNPRKQPRRGSAHARFAARARVRGGAIEDSEGAGFGSEKPCVETPRMTSRSPRAHDVAKVRTSRVASSGSGRHALLWHGPQPKLPCREVMGAFRPAFLHLPPSGNTARDPVGCQSTRLASIHDRFEWLGQQSSVWR
jgi:hypothetical protein